MKKEKKERKKKWIFWSCTALKTQTSVSANYVKWMCRHHFYIFMYEANTALCSLLSPHSAYDFVKISSMQFNITKCWCILYYYLIYSNTNGGWRKYWKVGIINHKKPSHNCYETVEFFLYDFQKPKIRIILLEKHATEHTLQGILHLNYKYKHILKMNIINSSIHLQCKDKETSATKNC